MPTKTDRILSYLPRTFRALPKPTALHAVVGAFGNELLQAENSLAEIMRSHWVDHADRGAELLRDLVCMAALYGLAPRGAAQNAGASSNLQKRGCPPTVSDESVEEFREHLKRYVRTFLDGTVTVQGILRVAADALGLRIDDDYEALDSWWRRTQEELTTVLARQNDAAKKILGAQRVVAKGSSAKAAEVRGTIDLVGAFALPASAKLLLKIDQATPLAISLPSGIATTLDDLVSAINSAPGVSAPLARREGHRLVLASPTLGAASAMEVLEDLHDAAPALLGLAPRVYHGSAATAARVTGIIDLSGKLDLSTERYLRLEIDGTHLAEIDCAGPTPSQTTLDQIRDAINGSLPVSVASHDGHYLTLTSPTTGFNSSIALQTPAAQEATARLFGIVERFHLGAEEKPATAISTRDLSAGLDLSQRANIKVRIDGATAVTIACKGEDPARTRLSEIVAKINAALGENLASHDGRVMTLSSSTSGASAELAFEALPEAEDATELIFGIASRSFKGADATAARLVGEKDLSTGVDLMAQNRLLLAVDGEAPREIELLANTDDPNYDPRQVSLADLAYAINHAFNANLASDDGQHLILASPTNGNASRLEIAPLENALQRRFVTRARVIDEAAQAIFGFISTEAFGLPATSARVVGKTDLSRGVDLRESRFLRLAIDDQSPRDFDCAGVRPRATTLAEIVQKLNDQLGANLASHDGGHLVLTSPSSGSPSRIAFETPRATEALDKLLGLAPTTVRGKDATRVSFFSTKDLSAGVDLSAAERVKIGVDGAPAVEIACAGADPAHTTLDEITMKINVALNAVIARNDGSRLILTSPTTGASSQLNFETPASAEATQIIFGINAPRSYHGSDATPARIIGNRDLSGGADLSVARFLGLAVDGQPPATIDCASQGTSPLTSVTLAQIVAAVTAAVGAGVASHDNSHLILTSKNTGSIATLALLPHTVGDARAKLFGDVPEVTTGSDPSPAIIRGETDLLTPVDCSERSFLRLAVNGGPAIDIDVAGAAPATTFLDEIVAKINAVIPNLASATKEDKLQLTSPTLGENSHLALLPLRYLEVIEYPAEPMATAPQAVPHGARWTINNDGAGEEYVCAVIRAPQGVVGATLVNGANGWQARLLTALRFGETARLTRDAMLGLKAEIISADHETRLVPGAKILVGPLGGQTWVPFAGTWHLSGDDEQPATLQLNNPAAPNLVLLRARRLGPSGHRITIAVTESTLANVPLPEVDDGAVVRLVGRVREEDQVFHLLDGNGAVLAILRSGAKVSLRDFAGQVAAAEGIFYHDEPPRLIVNDLARLFDVVVRDPGENGGSLTETFSAVTLGLGATREDALARQINIGASPSKLVKAEELNKGAVLALPQGKTEWTYLDCHSSRFNHADFNAARFAGGVCHDRAVFNVSRFAETPPEPVAAVFAAAGETSNSTAEVSFQWESHRPGAFVVNLPVDLPAKFGGAFNAARFGQRGEAAELYKGVVTEPASDANFIVDLLNEKSQLVTAAVVPRTPLGFTAVAMPFRKPQFLKLGNEGEAARLYLSEEGINGVIELRAKESGAAGNAISVAARKAGPAIFEVAIAFQGGRFENARQAVLGAPLETLTDSFIKPGPIGVLQAKAAGIAAAVTRERSG